MNHLQFESSPYLKQHADNPVDWYAWNEETLKLAKALDKPILLSIGYSTCHWCHVMEKESFTDAEIAEYMNYHFINIKIDREERPDLDSIFMDACQAMTGKSGWPLHVFLTPERQPFFAGIYFPTEPRRDLMSWTQALQYVVYNFKENRLGVENQAKKVVHQLKNDLTRQSLSKDQSDPALLAAHLKEGFFKNADLGEGGFGKTAKFPNTEALEFLLSHARYYPSSESSEFVKFSVDKMLKGGIYDQIGSGIARYSIDRFWRIPHFEKMLYDNAAFIKLLASLVKSTGNAQYKIHLHRTTDFIRNEMRDPEGGFYTGIDADSEGREGAYYTWGKQELEAIAGVDAPQMCRYFGVEDNGNWEGTNILWTPTDIRTFCEREQLDPASFQRKLEKIRQKLYLVRQKRIAPFIDKKIILGWNALVVSALAKAFEATGDTIYRQLSLETMHYLTANFFNRQKEVLWHYRIDGQNRIKAPLSDYALLIKACIDLFQISYDQHWLDLSKYFTTLVISRFSDDGSALFFENSRDQDDIFYRKKEIRDGDFPSSNAVMAWNLDTLGFILGETAWQNRAWQMLKEVEGAALADPLSYSFWARQLLLKEKGRLEIAVVGEDAISLADKINREFLPGKVLVAASDPNDELPLLAHRWKKDQTQIFLCHHFACQRPVKTIHALMEQVEDI
jgi:uncharacterized protein YyaL (SSP411 family)